MNFDGIIGHNKIKTFLQRSLEKQIVNHAYLLTGQEGLGKSTIAKFFITQLLCSENKACGQCPNCRQLVGGQHPDVWLIERQPEKQDISIEQIRQLHEFIALGSFTGGWRVVVINGAHYLNAESSNALLKSLEEPPAKVVFILLSAEPGKLLATIRSRCYIMSLGLVSAIDIADLLIQQGAAAVEAREIAQLAAGRPGVALNLWQQPEELKRQLARARLFLNLLKAKGFAKTVKYFESEFKEAGAEAGQVRLQALSLVKIWQEIARDMLCMKLGLNKLVRYSSLVAEINTIAKINLQQLFKINRLLHQAECRLQSNAHVRLTLEWAAFSIRQA